MNVGLGVAVGSGVNVGLGVAVGGGVYVGNPVYVGSGTGGCPVGFVEVGMRLQGTYSLTSLSR